MSKRAWPVDADSGVWTRCDVAVWLMSKKISVKAARALWSNDVAGDYLPLLKAGEMEGYGVPPPAVGTITRHIQELLSRATK